MNTRNTNRNSIRTSRTANAAALVALLAGSSLAFASGPGEKRSDKHENTTRQHTTQNGTTSRQNAQNTDRTHAAKASLAFAYGSDLIGASLINSSEDGIGDVEDLIVDRSNGRITYAIVNAGGFMGLGGKTFAMRFDDLSYMAGDNTFHAALTDEQIKRRTEFLAENWSGLKDRSWMDRLTGAASEEPNDTRDRWNEPGMIEVIEDGHRVTIEGTVDSVDRYNRMGTNEVHVGVKESDGSITRVVLGPAWHIMGLDNVPNVGDKIEIETVDYKGEKVATDATVAGKTIRILDDNNRSVWNSGEVAQGRYALLSDIIGASTEISGSTSGEIQDVIIESNTGDLALVAFDPNDNFLGLGDELTAIPWDKFRPGADGVYMMSITERQAKNAPQIPDDLTMLSNRSRIAAFFDAFDSETPRFDRDRTSSRENSQGYTNGMSPNDRRQTRAGDPWSRDSMIVTTFRGGEDVEVSGTFAGWETVTLIDGTPPARVLLLKQGTDNNRFIVGPVWFTENQNLDLDKGDRITIIGRNAEVDGMTRTAVWNLTRDGRTWTFWDNDNPRWAD